MTTPPRLDQPEGTDILGSPDGGNSAHGPWKATIAADGSDRESDKPAGEPVGLPIETAPDTSPAEAQGERIGRYKLLQQIGEGGFGTVWMAEQTEPVTRRVALKIIKLGMDTREVIARFEQERQALAMMDHPNIAKVLDAGATDKGRPFFVMELVKGVPVTQYCDEAGLCTRERLALFGDVCSAIQHAHQKGIIHRDIKPTNVMVTLHGDKPVAKVIDFGIAKATHGKLTDKTLFTQFEQFIGTPVYMSPEQVSLSGLDIDTRSDIYALGVLLYELLTGKPPFDAKSLISAGLEEMRRIIREVEPPKPSLRLSTVAGDERITVAKARRIGPEKLGRLVEPDLDWIVMKAIDKDRTRRYETASAFAQDIAYFLTDQPVSATPPSAGYQFRKFARRNRAALRVGAAIAAVLVAATAVSTWQAVRATQAESKTAETLAEVAAERDAKERARAAATRAEKMTAETLAEVAAERDAKERARASVDSALKFGEDVLALSRKVQSRQHIETLIAMHNLSDYYSAAGRKDEALKLREEVLTLFQQEQGPEHPFTLFAMGSLANSYSAAGRRDEALILREEILALRHKVHGPEHPATLSAMTSLANSYSDAGRQDEAFKLREELLPLSLKVLGLEHPDTRRVMTALANSYREKGEVDKAEALEKELAGARAKAKAPPPARK